MVYGKVDIGRGEVQDAVASPNGSSSGADSCDAALHMGQDGAPAGPLRDFSAFGLDIFLASCIVLRDLTGDNEFRNMTCLYEANLFLLWES